MCAIEESLYVTKYTLNLLILSALVQVGPKNNSLLLITVNHDKCKGAPPKKLTFIYLLNCSILLWECVGTKGTAEHSYVRSNW